MLAHLKSKVYKTEYSLNYKITTIRTLTNLNFILELFKCN